MDKTQETMLFCERTLPLMVHIQMCEGLQSLAVNEDLQSNLINFDREKLTTHMNYIKACERSPPNLILLRKRIEEYGYYLDE
jgi:hypothetical protein